MIYVCTHIGHKEDTKLKERTANNVHKTFAEEAKAHQKLLMFAKQAEKEGLPQIAHLFRAVAAAEGVHSRRHFALLESGADTQTNLEQTFQLETAVNGMRVLTEGMSTREACLTSEIGGAARIRTGVPRAQVFQKMVRTAKEARI